MPGVPRAWGRRGTGAASYDIGERKGRGGGGHGPRQEAHYLREEGIDTSVIVVTAGSGVPADAPDMSTSSIFGLDQIEVDRIQQFKLALIHLGNVRNHIIYKARLILRNVDIPAVVVCQAPVDFEDFARIGVKTRMVRPRKEDIGTKGEIVDIVTGVVRGTTSPQHKLDEIVSKVRRNL